ncbi:hypothetical protein A5663_09360 [Mycobacterium sp. E740]|nr:hypothetical protein A5663_09360 [Mycobacterium sp. E740]
MPLRRIGAELCKRGEDVAMLTGVEYHDQVTAEGMRFFTLPDEARPARPSVTRPMAGSRLNTVLDRWKQGRLDLASVFISPLNAQFEALRRVLAASRFDVVLCDLAFTGALALLLSGVPRPRVVVCGVGPLMLSSVDTPPFGVGWQPRHQTSYRAMNIVVQRVLFRGIQRSLNRSLEESVGVGAPVFIADWPLLADCMLQLTVPQLEYPRSDLASSVVFSGPILATLNAEEWERPQWWPLLSEGRKVVHVTQGTWDNGHLNQLIMPTVKALRDRADVMVVVTTGRRGQHTLDQPCPPNVYVTDFIDYTQLLPYVDLMVTNGGYGGVHEALAHAVPLIIAGQTADKHEVAARVAYAGAGLDLGTARPTPATISDAVQRVMRTESYRAAATALQRRITECRAHETIAELLEISLDNRRSESQHQN